MAAVHVMNCRDVPLSVLGSPDCQEYLGFADEHEPLLLVTRFPRAGVRLVLYLGKQGEYPFFWPEDWFFIQELVEWWRDYLSLEVEQGLKEDFRKEKANGGTFPFMNGAFNAGQTTFCRNLGKKSRKNTDWVKEVILPDRDDVFERFVDYVSRWYETFRDWMYAPILADGNGGLGDAANQEFRLLMWGVPGEQMAGGIPFDIAGRRARVEKILSGLRDFLRGNSFVDLKRSFALMYPGCSVGYTVGFFSTYWPRRSWPDPNGILSFIDEEEKDKWEEVYALRARLIRQWASPIFYINARSETNTSVMEKISYLPVPVERVLPFVSYDAYYETYNFCIEMESKYPILTEHPLEDLLGVALVFFDPCDTNV